VPVESDAIMCSYAVGMDGPAALRWSGRPTVGTVLDCADPGDAARRAGRHLRDACGYPPLTPYFVWPEARPDLWRRADVPDPNWEE
jgi:hypothetical protein